jgi:DNA-binding MarR family transcriptional regulator
MINNTTKHVLEVISKYPAMTTTEIAAETGLQIENVNYHVRILRRGNLIYVSAWIQSSRNVPTMMLTSGNRLDAEKPPLKPQTIKKHEKKLKTHSSFKPRPDEAAAWLTNPIIPRNLDMSAR